MNFVPNPPDGAVQALSALTNLAFGRAKWLYDGIMLIIAVVISLVATGGVIGIGIGTVVAFFTIGNMIHLINKQFGNQFRAIYDKDKQKETASL